MIIIGLTPSRLLLELCLLLPSTVPDTMAPRCHALLLAVFVAFAAPAHARVLSQVMTMRAKPRGRCWFGPMVQ